MTVTLSPDEKLSKRTLVLCSTGTLVQAQTATATASSSLNNGFIGNLM